MICALLPILLTLAACGEAEDTHTGQPVKHRRLAFQEMLKVFEPMGTMLRTNEYDVEKFANLGAELRTRRDAPWEFFAPDTNYPPTKAKPEVWSKAGDFAAEKRAFLAATDELLTATQTGQRAQVERAYFNVYEHCQSCHKAFRNK
jgi:cytochrome c556